MQPTAVSLLCGAGGFDLGLERAGFKIIYGIDIDETSCQTYRHNFSNKVVNEDFFSVNSEDIPQSDLIISSLPASSFSTTVRYSYKSTYTYNEKVRYEDKVYEIIQSKKPKVFIIEGHKNFAKEHKFNSYLDLLKSIGYRISCEILNTKNYGIAQNKDRLIIVGVMDQLNITFKFPLKHSEIVPLKDVIKVLDHIDNKERKKISFTNEKRWNGYREINLEGVSPSINPMTMLIFKDPSNPSEYFTLTWKEVAAIQSFPDDFGFEGTIKSKLKQIGNSFPPQLAYLLANELIQILKQDIQNYSDNLKELNEKKVENDSLRKDINLPIESLKSFEKESGSPNLFSESVGFLQQEQQEQQEQDDYQDLKDLIGKPNDLLYQLKELQAGLESSEAYKKLIFRCFNYIFSESLKRGRMEFGMNSRRKRIDIIFDNHANSGFFYFIRESYKVFCPRIIIECKNGGSDPANPDVDQLMGRFGKDISKFGFLTFRRIGNRKKFMDRCKDVLAQSGNYILFLVDDDIEKLINLKMNSDEEGILDYMLVLWDELTIN
ncbi:DNA cytosine methyltransferase [Paenibacillus sp. FSL R7-0331]|uniref:DNA cytosine methyltransferase n=1 Tax=Paenibacillus sp. FSL R7-0331 TaxID=1536773 RepID=UPI0004F79033|nr:DNA (cytosine-5-)-methyltransferase [Paenibacillus sp. FSL R7-0331]AIQ50657.1 hypothetical protein R70331_03285 [Paenibacillus sp. FSL R7-0331]